MQAALPVACLAAFGDWWADRCLLYLATAAKFAFGFVQLYKHIDACSRPQQVDRAVPTIFAARLASA